MYSSVDRARIAAPALLALSLLTDIAAAQPTAAQQNAIRSQCRSDFLSNCSGVTPGGAEALQCLKRNASRLSPGCQTAVNALNPPAPPRQTTAAPAPPPAPAAAASPAPSAAAAPPAPAAVAPATTAAAPAGEPSAQQRAALRKFCQDDFIARCQGVPIGTPQALQCLERNAAQVSPGCQGVLATIGDMPAAAAPPRAAAPQPAQRAATHAAPPPAKNSTPPPAARPAPAAAAAVHHPTAQQQAALRQACQSDFMARCRGVQPGGAQALQCLQRNTASLSPGCRSAVAALGGSAAPAAAATTTAAAPASAPTQQQLSAIKFTCRRDFMRNCRGVPQGGPEALACLQRNAARLSPDCRTSLAAIADTSAATATSTAAAPTPAARPLPPGPFPLRRAIRERMLNR